MSRTDLLSLPPSAQNRQRQRRAFGASCALHGFALCLLLGLTFLFEHHQPPPQTGSAAGSPTLTLSTMLIAAPSPEPTRPVPIPIMEKPAPIPPAPIPSVTATPPPRAAIKLPEAGVPVLSLHPIPSPHAVHVTPNTSAHHPPALRTPASSQPKPEAAAPSSYAPGESVLPHPPYPPEARDLQQTGTVLMNVKFDAQGGVTQADVAHSSGFLLLDTTTRMFIRSHWHSTAFAGQTICVPVQYNLEKL